MLAKKYNPSTRMCNRYNSRKSRYQRTKFKYEPKFNKAQHYMRKPPNLIIKQTIQPRRLSNASHPVERVEVTSAIPNELLEEVPPFPVQVESRETEENNIVENTNGVINETEKEDNDEIEQNIDDSEHNTDIEVPNVEEQPKSNYFYRKAKKGWRWLKSLGIKKLISK